MFDNTLKEEAEDEEPVASPGLTNSSSTASDEGTSFSRYPPTPPELGFSSSILPNNKTGGKPIAGWEPSNIAFPSDSGSGVAGGVSFPNAPIPPRPTTPSRKLKKKNRDGYESDGGYLSEGTKKSQKKEEKARLKQEKKDQKEEERKRKKSQGAASKSKVVEDFANEADPSKKSKAKKSKGRNASPDGAAGYETDGGYVSASSKKPKGRFFKLSLKGSRSDLKAEAAEEVVPPMPREPLPLPIAQRFASPPGSAATSSQGHSLDLTAEARPSTQSVPFQVPAPGAPLELLTLDATQPLSMDDVATRQRSPPPPRSTQPIDTNWPPSSYSSPSQRAQAPTFVSYEEASIGHGNASSISTLSSSGHSSSGHSATPTGSSQSTTPTPITHTTSSSNLSISYPLTRGTSPIPPSNPSAPFNAPRNLHQNLPHLQTQSRNASPLPLSPHSPYVMVTPSVSHAPSPVRSAGHLPPQSSSGLVRPRNPPTEGFGPRGLLTSAPPPNNNNNGRLSPNPVGRARRLSPLLVPEGHPDATPLASPNVLAYYDIPPPSPPPMGPLPSVPVGSSPSPPSSSSSHLRSKGPERQQPEPTSLLVPQPSIQRGRVSPFPTQPVTSPKANNEQGAPSAHMQRVPGLEARKRTTRYRDTRAVSPVGGMMRREPEQQSISPPRQRLPLREPRHRVHWEQRHSDEVIPPVQQQQQQKQLYRYSQESDDDDEEDEEESTFRVSGADDIRDVLDRFVETSEESVSFEGPNVQRARTIPRSRSFEAALEETRPREEIAVPREPSTYTWEDDEMGLNNNHRESRWSGSIYSRISILDEDQSGQTRDRFIQRVEAMVKAKEKGEVVPPVPALPEGLANARSWNKF
ncbi:hypothetical protein BKA70DRAFT_1373199 [Coprinopsis sp. MPI-PUGE-AT-0042]|nr:hypothetical protein BKA70DRAFT_1373199 [Coprinopsis sp. MPI-PUGE-AT-0042]